MTFSTPDLCDAFESDIQVFEPVFTHYGAKTAFSGEVVTVKCFEDNSRVKELLATAGEGRVLVVDGAGSLRRSLLGDMLAAAGVDNGWSGVVIHGAVRDVELLETLEIGILALAAIPLKTEKLGVGEINLDLNFAGVTIHPGDYLYADKSGTVVAQKPLSLD